MKIILTTICLIIGSSSVWAQTGAISLVSNHTYSVEDDTLSIYQTTYFPVGGGTLCPNLSFYNFDIVGTEIVFDLYYDLSGAYPSGSCNRKDTIREIFNYGVYSLVVNKYSFGLTSTILEDSDTSYLVTLNTNIEKEITQLSVFPNPAQNSVQLVSDINLEGMDYKIFTSTGQEINSGKISNGKIQLDYAPGLYFLQISNELLKPKSFRLILE